jgi:hypothetical protein
MLLLNETMLLARYQSDIFLLSPYALTHAGAIAGTELKRFVSGVYSAQKAKCHMTAAHRQPLLYNCYICIRMRTAADKHIRILVYYQKYAAATIQLYH